MHNLRFRPADAIAAEAEALRRRLRQALRAQMPAARTIHRLRVICKRLRSLVRLCRHHASDKLWRRYDHALRTVAAAFAAARDRKVLHDTVTLLLTQARSQRTQAACKRVLAQLRRQQRVTCLRDAAAEALALAPFPTEALTVKQFDRGLQRTHRRCRKLARYAIAGGTDAAQLHVLRKQVKYLGYQLELAAVPTSAVVLQHKQLATLGSQLGFINDLAVLEQQLPVVAGINAADAVLIATLAARLQRQAQERAARLATLLFTGK